MRLSGKCTPVDDGNNDKSTSGGGDAVCRGVAAVVGVKLDTRSKELLTWALVKIAQPGDTVIALHVLNPNGDKSEMLSLLKTFDSMVAAYEGFCNLKQVDLKFKVCRGSPAQKVLAGETNIYNAPNLVVGTSSTHHSIRSSVAVAKYCARKVKKSISVIAVNNGKIVFHREATASIGQESLILLKGKTLIKSPLLPFSNGSDEGTSLDLVPVKTMEARESNTGSSALLRRMFLQNMKSGKHSAKASSLLQWVQRLQCQQHVGAVYLDDEQNVSDKECHSSNLDVVIAAPNEKAWFQIPKELEDLCEKYSPVCRLFSYQELLTATSSFMPENLIGKGGSSKVYKGCLPDGEELAVKIFKPSEVVVKQFRSEIEIITTLRHKHIISLLGFCIEDNLLLVYDLLSRGSLDDNLHGARNVGNSFGWNNRYKVASGVAQALDHLHNSATGSIIHRDVKSSNILLSDDFEPKLSDFGLAIFASFSSCDLDGSDIAGTFGYLAPEYFMHGKINEKIDVYAYGVVLLELLSGRKPIDNMNAKGQESLVMWAKQTLKDGKPTDLLDANLLDTYNQDEFERMVLAATLCIKRAPKLRPSINTVVKLLQGEEEAVNWARQQVNGSEEADFDGEQHPPPASIQSFLNVALQNLECDSISSCSSHQNIFVEDYLRGRFSRSSSFE